MQCHSKLLIGGHSQWWEGGGRGNCNNVVNVSSFFYTHNFFKKFWGETDAQFIQASAAASSPIWLWIPWRWKQQSPATRCELIAATPTLATLCRYLLHLRVRNNNQHIPRCPLPARRYIPGHSVVWYAHSSGRHFHCHYRTRLLSRVFSVAHTCELANDFFFRKMSRKTLGPHRALKWLYCMWKQRVMYVDYKDIWCCQWKAY